MSTPPASKNKAKHPAVRALEGQLLPGDSVPVDILTATPNGCLDVSCNNVHFMKLVLENALSVHSCTWLKVFSSEVNESIT